MCVSFFECCSKVEFYLFITSFLTILLSLIIATAMFILSYPGDECLLFVSVRGEALIYGNPAGCNFISYGHSTITAVAVVICLIIIYNSCKNKSNIKEEHKLAVRRSSVSQVRIVMRANYSFKFLAFSVFVTIFVILSAIITLSGYLVTCGELAYETRRQIYAKTTLGTPVKSLSIACTSIFRDVDFHNRFHYDHYEFSGQWHGQYRGQKHGRVHQYEYKHQHIIPVATALEISMVGTFLSAAVWIVLISLLIHLRRRQKQQQRNDYAESMENAHLQAQMGLPLQMDSSTSIHHEMKHQNLINQDPGVISNSDSSNLRLQAPKSASCYLANNFNASVENALHHRPPISSHQHNNLISMLPNIQYVQLTNGTLVPISHPDLQQHSVNPQSLSHVIPDIRSHKSTSSGIGSLSDRYMYSNIPQEVDESVCGLLNNDVAQKDQLHYSEEIGLKCSRI